MLATSFFIFCASVTVLKYVTLEMHNRPQGGFTKKTSLSLPERMQTSSMLRISEKLQKEMNATFSEVTDIS